jgi:small subunit ribosomal protein S16
VLRIRLRRTGKAHQPSYRIVVADQRAKRDGDFVEVLGHYNPRSVPKVFEIKQERLAHYLANGAQPTETLHRLLQKNGLWDVEPPKRVTKQSNVEKEAAAAAAKAEADARAAAAAEAAAAETARVAAAAAASAEAETPTADADADKPAE